MLHQRCHMQQWLKMVCKRVLRKLPPSRVCRWYYDKRSMNCGVSALLNSTTVPSMAIMRPLCMHITYRRLQHSVGAALVVCLPC